MNMLFILEQYRSCGTAFLSLFLFMIWKAGRPGFNKTINILSDIGRIDKYINMRSNSIINIEDVPGLETELQMVNMHIERLCRSNSESMQKMLDWVLNARGKQIRPLLTLLCARLKGKTVDATEAAAVIEICHTASLIYDDVVDEADTRRGQLSVQKKFGKEMAVYAGDFMIFSAIRRTGLKNRPWYGSMFDKLETMCDGEVSQFDNRYNTEITEEKYIENILGKTSAMFRIACGAGACEGKSKDSEILAAEQFAEKFGLLFQLRDDLLDFVFTDDLAMKTVHNDFWCGYYTLPVIHSFSDCRNGAGLKQIAVDIKNGLYNELTDKRIVELINVSDGFGYTLMMSQAPIRSCQSICLILL